MLKQVSNTDILALNIPDIRLNAIFVEITSKSVNVNSVYFIFYKNLTPIIAFALYENKKRIVLPTHGYPYYSGIWIKNHKDYSNDLYEALKLLLKNYKSVDLILPPEINDVRAFIWCGFSAKVKYTYIKKSNNKESKDDVKSNYKKAKSLNLKLTTEESIDFDWFNYETQLKRLGFSNISLKQLKIWITSLEKNSLVMFFKVLNKNNDSLGSGIVLLNRGAKVGGLLLNYVPKNSHQSAVNSFLYLEIQNWLNINGFDYFDYLGANTKSIADFKKRFNPDLKSYFLVRYKKNSVITNVKNKFLLIFNK